jgi:hypothetical protein
MRSALGRVFMDIHAALQEMKKTATGTLGFVIGDLVSTPKAFLDGAAALIHGKSEAEASMLVREQWAKRGQKFGTEHSDEIAKALREAVRIVAEQRRRQAR